VSPKRYKASPQGPHRSPTKLHSSSVGQDFSGEENKTSRLVPKETRDDHRCLHAESLAALLLLLF